jgi:hypothetical protein
MKNKKTLKWIYIVFATILFSCTEDTTQVPDVPQVLTGFGSFWINADSQCGPITVYCNGNSRNITGFLTSTIPYCGDTGIATFELVPGAYPFTASCSSKSWSGTIIITAGGCSKMQLTSNGGTSGTGGSLGQGTFWAASDLGCGNINVVCNGQTKIISNYYSSGVPSCGTSGSATFDLPAGNYSYTASCSNKTWGGTITIIAGGCFKLQLKG